MANEKRLIDKDALIALCDSPHWCVWMSEIEDFPTVDAVEVVRCKDCKHMEVTPDCLRWCNVWNGINGMGDDGFCNYGERKDNG